MQHLKDIRVDMVSLVDRAAVRDPQRKSEPRRFVLTKRDTDGDAAISKKGAAMPATDIEGVDALSKEEQDTLKALLSKVGGASEKVKGERFPGDDDLDDTRDDKSLKKGGPTGEDGADGPSKGAGVTDAGSEATKSEIAGLSKSEFEVLPEAAKSALLKAEQTSGNLAAALAKADQNAAEALQVAKSEQDLRKTSEFIAKAEGEFQNLSVTPTEFGPVLKRASEMLSKEDYDALTQVLKGANDAVYQGDLMREQGRSGEIQKASDPERQLLAKADEIQKGDPSINASAAFLQAVRDNPELARGYEAQR